MHFRVMSRSANTEVATVEIGGHLRVTTAFPRHASVAQTHFLAFAEAILIAFEGDDLSWICLQKRPLALATPCGFALDALQRE